MKSLPGRICRVLFFNTKEARGESRSWEDGVGHAGPWGRCVASKPHDITALAGGKLSREGVPIACSGKSITR